MRLRPRKMGKVRPSCALIQLAPNCICPIKESTDIAQWGSNWQISSQTLRFLSDSRTDFGVAGTVASGDQMRFDFKGEIKILYRRKGINEYLESAFCEGFLRKKGLVLCR